MPCLFNIIDVCIEIKLTTRLFASEISWTFANICNSNQQYQDNQEYSQTCCIRTIYDWEHELKCTDTHGDGWHDAYITINGRRYCEDFLHGEEKTAIIEANPSKSFSLH